MVEFASDVRARGIDFAVAAIQGRKVHRKCCMNSSIAQLTDESCASADREQSRQCNIGLDPDADGLNRKEEKKAEVTRERCKLEGEECHLSFSTSE